jgi:four helix bundle protein
MSAQSEELKERTIVFAINVFDLIDNLPATSAGKVIGYQLAKCAPSVGANYRASCNGRSRREFIAKLGVVVEESEESVYWLEIIRRRRMVSDPIVSDLFREATEFRAIFSRSLGTARANARAARDSTRQK